MWIFRLLHPAVVSCVWQSFSSALFNLRPSIWLLKDFLSPLNVFAESRNFGTSHPPPKSLDQNGRDSIVCSEVKEWALELHRHNKAPAKQIPSGVTGYFESFYLIGYFSTPSRNPVTPIIASLCLCSGLTSHPKSREQIRRKGDLTSEILGFAAELS